MIPIQSNRQSMESVEQSWRRGVFAKLRLTIWLPPGTVTARRPNWPRACGITGRRSMLIRQPGR